MYFIILVFCLFYVQTLYILNQLVAKKYTHVSYSVVFWLWLILTLSSKAISRVLDATGL